MPLFDLNRTEISEILAEQPAYRCNQLWTGIYEGLSLPSEQTNLPKSLRLQLENLADTSLGLTESKVFFTDDKRTIKTLYALSDGREIESVLMKYADRVTLCVSSQAGCAMGCVFCATGQAGYFRNLTRGEILEQVFLGARTSRDIFGSRLSNVVFMGMGEPMANFDNVIEAIQRIAFDFTISARHITLSTVGIVPGIRRLADQALPISLAVSLHAATNEKRSKLIPINKQHPIEALMESLEYFRSSSNRRISFEWALMADINDSIEDARELANLAHSISAHVNLIPLNPTPQFPFPGSSTQVVNDFRNKLIELGVNATIRKNRGNQIAAACGQLVTQSSTRGRARKDVLPFNK